MRTQMAACREAARNPGPESVLDEHASPWGGVANDGANRQEEERAAARAGALLRRLLVGPLEVCSEGLMDDLGDVVWPRRVGAG